MNNTDKAIRRHLLNGEREFKVGRDTRTRSATHVEVKDIQSDAHIVAHFTGSSTPMSIWYKDLGLRYDPTTKTFKEI